MPFWVIAMFDDIYSSNVQLRNTWSGDSLRLKIFDSCLIMLISARFIETENFSQTSLLLNKIIRKDISQNFSVTRNLAN